MGCGASSSRQTLAGLVEEGAGGSDVAGARALGVLQRGMRANELNELQVETPPLPTHRSRGGSLFRAR